MRHQPDRNPRRGNIGQDALQIRFRIAKCGGQQRQTIPGLQAPGNDCPRVACHDKAFLRQGDSEIAQRRQHAVAARDADKRMIRGIAWGLRLSHLLEVGSRPVKSGWQIADTSCDQFRLFGTNMANRDIRLSLKKVLDLV